MKLAIGSDHAGFRLKKKLIDFFSSKGTELTDFGTNSEESADYPDFAHPVANAVEKGEVDFGILICGSGNGISMAANKHSGIRCAICWNEEIARLARKHNNANILALPARFLKEGEAEKIAYAFFNEPFEGGRHQKRVEKINPAK